MEYLRQGYIALTLLLTLIQTSVCQQQDITVKYDNESLTKLSTSNNTGEIIIPAKLGSGFDINMPADIRLEWQGSPMDLVVNISQLSGEFAELSILAASIDDENIASLQNSNWVAINCSSVGEMEEALLSDNSTRVDRNCESINIVVHPIKLGRTKLELIVFSRDINGDKNLTETHSINVSVIKTKRKIDKIFNITLFLLLGTVTFGMGTSINLKTVKETLKRPKAPGIALLCQFVIMPLLSYAIIWLEGYRGGAALGFFSLGCAPGGGMSNMYAHLLGGDMSISITLTLMSTLICVGTIPFWLFTLGTTLPTDGEQAVIPFTVILQAFALLVVPLAIGLLIQYKLPKVAQTIHRCLSVLMVLILVFLCVFGIYTNLYIFYMFNIRTLCASMLLPFGGFFLGGSMAAICKFDWKVIKTIAIETGLQNGGVPFFMIQMALTSPDLELATIPIVYISALTPIPMLTIILCYTMYNKIKSKRDAARNSADIESHSDTSSDISSQNSIEKIDMMSDEQQLGKELLPVHTKQTLAATAEDTNTSKYEKIDGDEENNELITRTTHS